VRSAAFGEGKPTDTRVSSNSLLSNLVRTACSDAQTPMMYRAPSPRAQWCRSSPGAPPPSMITRCAASYLSFRASTSPSQRAISTTGTFSPSSSRRSRLPYPADIKPDRKCVNLFHLTGFNRGQLARPVMPGPEKATGIASKAADYNVRTRAGELEWRQASDRGRAPGSSSWAPRPAPVSFPGWPTPGSSEKQGKPRPGRPIRNRDR
jgi:hypothetical protein